VRDACKDVGRIGWSKWSTAIDGQLQAMTRSICTCMHTPNDTLTGTCTNTLMRVPV